MLNNTQELNIKDKLINIHTPLENIDNSMDINKDNIDIEIHVYDLKDNLLFSTYNPNNPEIWELIDNKLPVSSTGSIVENPLTNIEILNK